MDRTRILNTLQPIAFVLFCFAVVYAASLVADWGWPDDFVR